MRRNLYILQLLAFTLILGGCTKDLNKLDCINFNSAQYYDSFLFVKAKSTPTTKKIEINFNKWADTLNSSVTLIMQPYDKDGTPADSWFGNGKYSNVSVYLNDKLCNNGEIYIDSKSPQIQSLRLEFSPDTKEKHYRGYFTIQSSDLDRINNEEEITSGKRIFKWSLRYIIQMNPLKKVLLWIIGIIVSIILLWFIILRNAIFKKFKRGKIIITSPYTKTIRLKGGRSLVFCSSKTKQTLRNKIFAGEIFYETNPLWQNEIIISPKDKQTLRIKLGIHYTIEPYTFQLKRGNSYEISNGKETIKISYL